MNQDIFAILDTLKAYIRGFYESDAKSLSIAFHPSGRLQGLHKGKPVELPIERWLEMVRKQSPIPTSISRSEAEVLSVTKQGPDAAFAVVYVASADAKYHDLLSMVRTQDVWKIVSKTFALVP
jgi:hypothetical protein